MFQENSHKLSNKNAKSSDFFWTQINQGVKKFEYAIQGVVPTFADVIKEQIDNKTKSYPFNQITFCNCGNPHEFHQKPITFNRQVLACLIDPELIQLQGFNKDAANRAKIYLNKIVSVGRYTNCTGIPFVRQTVSKFISQQDSVQAPSPDNIILTQGASQGIQILFKVMITSENDSIMLPIPQFPLYSAVICLNGGHFCPYYLNEQKQWKLDEEQLQNSIEKARKDGKNVKSIVVINPGNPTGGIFNVETIKKIISFAVKNRLVLIADEVYRQNIYKQGAKFASFRRVLQSMDQYQKNKCQLASLHSVSKGLLGQGGLRGGYLYIHNFNPKITEQIIKLKNMNQCSNSIGQVMVDLMCNPPLQEVSEATKLLYLKQIAQIYNSLKQRANLVTKLLRGMRNITTNQVQGAMYAYAQIKFSKKAIKAAGEQQPDVFYCLQVVKNTGIVLVPGSGFGQRPGTYHFRITTLILPKQKLIQKLQSLKQFNEQFHKKYE